MRQQLAGDDEERIANAITAIDAMATRAGFRYDGWEGFAYTNNAAVLDYLQRHIINRPPAE